MKNIYAFLTLILSFIISCQSELMEADYIIKGGMIYNGSGEAPFEGDVVI